MKNFIQACALLAAATITAHAHFVFVVPQTGNTTAIIFISETLKPDHDVDIELVKDTKLSLRGTNGRELELKLEKANDVYSTSLPSSGTRVIHGLADLGISGSGEKQYLLLYHPKTILGDAFDSKTMVGTAAPTELVPIGKSGALKLRLLGRGKPLPDAEVTVLLPDGTDKLVKTDKAGETEVFTQTGRYGAWARFWETDASGERNSKKYPETHHYATLVFDAPGSLQADAAGSKATLFANLPEATASFGEAVSDGWLYIYGGHISPTHNYFVGAVSGRFHRLRLNGAPAWEELHQARQPKA